MPTNKDWPPVWPVTLGEAKVDLPLKKCEDDFWFYGFNPMATTNLSDEIAGGLFDKTLRYRCDVILTAELKAITMAEHLAFFLGHEKYIILRKGVKRYMSDPVEVNVQSITTLEPQKFYLDSDDAEYLKDKRVCIVDDVMSTGGTMGAFFEMSRIVGFKIVVIAVALTEGNQWTEYDGVPVVALDHIPLPGFVR